MVLVCGYLTLILGDLVKVTTGMIGVLIMTTSTTPPLMGTMTHRLAALVENRSAAALTGKAAQSRLVARLEQASSDCSTS